MTTPAQPSLDDDLLAEGDPEVEFHAGIAARMPGKRVASAALIRDETGRVLFVDPVYKSDWILPGGLVEAGEDPVSACRREVQEELGLDLVPGPLLVVDWTPPHGVWGDAIQFVFDGGRLPAARLPELTLQAEEVVSVIFASMQDAAPRLRPSQNRRLAAALVALEQGRTQYLQFGRPR